MDEKLRASIEAKTGLRVGRPTRSEVRAFWMDFAQRCAVVLVAAALFVGATTLCALLGGGAWWWALLPVAVASIWLCDQAGVTADGVAAAVGLLGLLGIAAGLIFGFSGGDWPY